MKKWICALAASATVAGAASVFAGVPFGDNRYFDWHDSSGTVPSNPPAVLPGAPGSAFSPANNDYTPSPFLTDGTAAQVDTYLQQAQAAGLPLAVKIPVPISNGGPAAQLFNKYNIKYVFADLEGPNSVAQTSALVQQIRNSSSSQSAQVGNYTFATVSNDPSTSPTYTGPSDPLDQEYRPTGVNLNTPQLYPGQNEYRQGPVPQTGGGTAPARDTAPDGTPIPNLRTGLFMGPVMRLSAVASNSPTGVNTIPYVSRFENTNNPSLDSDGNPSNGFVFNNPTGDQMLSRQDFEAQMLHYRMRGATGFHLHEPGVVGYTQAQFQNDAKKGWEAANNQYGYGTPTGTGNNVNTNPNNAAPVNMGLTVQDALDGQFHNVENEGVVFSGVANQTAGNGGLGGMSILVSNLSGSNKYIILPNRIANGRIVGVIPNADNSTPLNPNNNGALPTGTVLIPAGSHRLLQFSKDANFNWNFVADATNLLDGGGATDRSGTGIPEPAALSLLGLAGFGLIVRRPRKVLA